MLRICSQSCSWSLVSSRYQLFYNDIEVGLLGYVVAGTAAVAGTAEPVREIGGADAGTSESTDCPVAR